MWTELLKHSVPTDQMNTTYPNMIGGMTSMQCKEFWITFQSRLRPDSSDEIHTVLIK